MKVKKRALIVTTVASTIDQFCMNDISILLQDFDVQVAANFTTGNNTSEERINQFKNELKTNKIKINEIEFDRNPINKNNIKAYKKLKELIVQNDFDLIHCHTPVAAMFTRLVSKRKRRKGTKVFYTAHGFHFYTGAPIINWLAYYPIEKLLSRYTDTLITINKEDYNRAKKSFKAGKVEYIPGVGIDTKKFSGIIINKFIKRKELGIPDDAVVILSVGELNKNKNHEIVIRALEKLNNNEIHYLICGQGSLENYLKELAKELGLEKQIHLLGFRKDVGEICKSSDFFVFPSLREGLGLAALEAMASGLPIITSNVHGIVDYSVDGITGYSCNPKDTEGFAYAIEKLINNDGIRIEMGYKNIDSVKKYDINSITNKMQNIYNENI